MEFTMTSPLSFSLSLSLFLSLFLRRPVIVNIRIINASTVEPKCLCCPDCKCSHIFRNLFGKNYPRLNIYIRSQLTKSKNEHLKESKEKMPTSVNHEPKKQIIQVRNIRMFFTYFLSLKMSRLVKLLTIIDWKWSRSSKIIWVWFGLFGFMAYQPL